MWEFRGLQQLWEWIVVNESGIREWMTVIGTVAAAAAAAFAANSSRRSAASSEHATRLSVELAFAGAHSVACGDFTEAHSIATRIIGEIPVSIGEWRGIAEGADNSGIQERIRLLERVQEGMREVQENASRLLEKVHRGGHSVAEAFAYKTAASKWLSIAHAQEAIFRSDTDFRARARAQAGG